MPKKLLSLRKKMNFIKLYLGNNQGNHLDGCTRIFSMTNSHLQHKLAITNVYIPITSQSIYEVKNGGRDASTRLQFG